MSLIDDLKAEMAAVGHFLSEGPELIASDFQKIRDYHYFTGNKNPLTAFYHMFFDEVSGIPLVADNGSDAVTPVETQTDAAPTQADAQQDAPADTQQEAAPAVDTPVPTPEAPPVEVAGDPVAPVADVTPVDAPAPEAPFVDPSVSVASDPAV